MTTASTLKACALLLPLLLCGCGGSAATPTPPPDYASIAGPLAHWRSFPVRVWFTNPQPFGAPDLKEAAAAGLDAWRAATGGKVRFVEAAGLPVEITVRFIPLDERPPDGQILGQTGSYRNASGEMTRGAIEMKVWPGVKAEDVATLAAHEMGHALGIYGHSDYPPDLMYPRFRPGRGTQPTQRDLNTLAIAYATVW